MMSLRAIKASLQECPAEELQSLCIGMAEVDDGNYVDVLRAASRQPPEVMRHTLVGVMTELEREHLEQEFMRQKPVNHYTKTEALDHALACAHDALNPVPDSQWRAMADFAGMSVEAYKQQSWKRMVTTFQDRD